MGARMGAAIPAEIALAALVFLLGLKHGLDPDHLVAIDGLTRSSANTKRRRWSGLFFSLGHGVVVTLVGVGLALAAADWRVPSWVEQFGALVSITVLITLGIANLVASVRAAPRVAGVRGRWVPETSHPVLIAAVGAGFAVSFDTLSHALLFSATGVSAALSLGLVFTLGMVLTDALNGWWVARMVGGTRLMSLTVAALCFAVAAMAVARLVGAQLFDAMAGFAPLVGAGTFGVLALAWLVGRRATIAFRI